MEVRASVVACLLAACTAEKKIATPAPLASATAASAPAVPDVPPASLACIVRYYGGEARRGADGWSLVLPNRAIVYDDGRTKTLYERFERPDVEDVFELAYKTGKIEPITDTDYDPGRIRIDELFFATYGASAREVERSLATVKLGGKWFAVHAKIKAPIERVAARIDEAMKRDASLAAFFESPGGTFNWRKIAGSDELSMHAWAIAIDLDTKRAHYWRNAPQNPLVWKNSYPQAIVDAFEAEGFIWGGRWYHFDTMHFEYRPELIDSSCYPKR